MRPAPAGEDPTSSAERALRRETLAWAARLSLPPVATTGAWHATPAGRAAHRVLRAIGANETLAALDDRARRGSRAPGRGDLDTGPFAATTAWFQAGDELAAAFADCPEALAQAGAIAEECRFAFEWGAFHFPEYPTENGESAFAMLWRVAFEGLAERYRPLPTEAIRRLQEELSVIEEKGFADYFLAIRDVAEWARAHHIPLVGRGSAANSLVSFCLGITHVEPLRHNLFFERFLNRERADCPDFDLDFCWRRRDRVLEYVYERFGAERVAMIATFCRLGARGALREVARALGVPDREISRVTGRVPHFSSVEMLHELRETLPECRGLPLDRPPWDEVVELALAIDMYPRHISAHPCGIVIAPGPIDRWVPRQMSAKGLAVTQFDMHPVEDIGLVKIDLLGNRGLSAIADLCDLLRERVGLEIRWARDEDAEEREEPGPGALSTIRYINPFRDPRLPPYGKSETPRAPKVKDQTICQILTACNEGGIPAPPSSQPAILNSYPRIKSATSFLTFTAFLALLSGFFCRDKPATLFAVLSRMSRPSLTMLHQSLPSCQHRSWPQGRPRPLLRDSLSRLHLPPDRWRRSGLHRLKAR